MKAAFISTMYKRYAMAVLPLALYKGCEHLQREDDGKWSTYTINKKRLIKVKIGVRQGKWAHSWLFNFDLVEQRYLVKKNKTTEAHLLLICDNIICSLSWREAQKLMTDNGKERQQKLRVERHKKDDQYTYTVKGSDSLDSWKVGDFVKCTPSGLDDLCSELYA